MGHYQLKIRNPENPEDSRIVELTREQWMSWREVLVGTGICAPEQFDRENSRLVISYYPGTFPQDEGDDEISKLL